MKKNFVMAIIVCLSAGLFLLTGCGDANKKCPGCGSVLVNNICPNICKVCKTGHVANGFCSVCERCKKCEKKKSECICQQPQQCPECKRAKVDCNCGKRSPVTQKATDRFHNRTLQAWVAMTGKGSDANWGFQKEANFRYDILVCSQSKIVEKKLLKSGGFRVIEERTFNTVKERLALSDVDIKLCLATIPCEQIGKVINMGLDLFSALSGMPAEPAKLTTNAIGQAIRKYDGIGARKLLESFGIKITVDIEQRAIELFGSNEIKALIRGKLKSIEGKTYRIKYVQDRKGVPLIFTFTYADGNPVTSEEECMVLNRVNGLIDHHTVPNMNCRIGESWTIKANDIQECFDPFVEGEYSGSIKVMRSSNDESGNWNVKMAPAQISLVGRHGETTGSMNLKEGRALVNPDKYSVSDVSVSGEAMLRKLSKHHMLFTSDIKGWCQFQGRLTSAIED